jgi:putative NADH-flavin reductase
MVVQGIEEQNHEFRLLIRKPENLDYTEEQKSKITVIPGDAFDPQAVKETIQGADVIVSSLGSLVDFKTMKLTEPGLCHKAMEILLKVVDELPQDERPKRLVVVSTTGLDDMSEVPYLFYPLYRWVLHDAHVDKRDLERLTTTENPHIKDWVIVRPTLLTNGQLTRKYKTGVGLSGYTVSRSDVGNFLLSQCIDKDEWLNKRVVITN